ncbi:MAG TPA: ABC-2 family transporter protein [Acidimicrobiales bacterium]|nr:ABC-2 family transporter protein [Acidimicrobiales bacterium]
MRLYWEVARRSFRRYSTYRAATFAGVFTNSVFGFIQAYILLAIFRTRPAIHGLDASAAVTYAFASQGFLAMMGAFGALELSERIRTGDVVSDLYRPVDLQRYWLANDMGRAGFQALARGLPPFLVGGLAFHLRVPTDPAVWAAFALCTTIGVAVSFAFRFVVSLSTFWLLDERGPTQLASVIALFFSGFILPLNLFPDGIRPLARALPWASYVQLPIEVFLGQHRGGAVLGVVAQQTAWLAVLLLAGRVVLAAATRKVVVQGG